MKDVYIRALCLVIITATPLIAQEETDIESAALAVEHLLDQQGTASIKKFIDQYMTVVEDREAVIDNIKEIRKELAGLRDDIGLDLDWAGAILTLASGDIEKRLRIKYDHSRQRITNIFILPEEEQMTFDLDDLDAAVQYMKDLDMAGLVYIKSNGETLLEEPFGMASEALRVPNSKEIIFAIGSRPIDFTKAAILLLDQQGKLSLDDVWANT